MIKKISRALQFPRMSVLIWMILISTAQIYGKDNFISAANSDSFQTGKKWRLGYYEGGSYINYHSSLVALIKGFMNMGWIEKAPLPVKSDKEDTYALWQWLCHRSRSRYITFVSDAYFTARWDTRERNLIKKNIISRLSEKKDIDLMIAMGTWAGQDLASPMHKTPTVVISSSDPLRAGIVKGEQFSGLDHVFTKVDPYRYRRQIELFHNIFAFKRLGVAYENTEAGKSYAGISDIEAVAKARGFTMESCYTISDIPDQKKAEESVRSCFIKLVKQVDAIYITQQGGINKETIGHLVQIANNHHIPTFSQAGSMEVKKGALLSLSQKDFDIIGKFYAENISKILKGAHPGTLNQILEVPPSIAINMKTAELIGFYLKTDILSAADEIYREIFP